MTALLDRLRPTPPQSAGWDIGLWSDGTPCTLPRRHALIAGLSGTGKSTLMHVLLARAARTPGLAIVAIDVKRVELRAWRPRLTTLAVDPDQVRATLTGLRAEMDRRYELLEQAGLVDWTTDLGARVLLVVDELAGVVATGERDFDRPNTNDLRALLERGRAAGVVVVLATQRPGADVIPTALRDLTGVRVCFAVPTVESAVMALGEPGRTAGAHQIPLDQPGRCVIVGDGDRTARRARIAHCTAVEAARIAVATAGLRQTLDITRHAAAPAQTAPEPATTDPRARPPYNPTLTPPTRTTTPLTAEPSPLPEPPPTTPSTGPSPTRCLTARTLTRPACTLPGSDPSVDPAGRREPNPERSEGAGVATQPSHLPGLDDTALQADDWAVLATLRQARRPLRSRAVYEILRTTTPFSVTRTERAITRLAAAGYLTAAGTAWQASV